MLITAAVQTKTVNVTGRGRTEAEAYNDLVRKLDAWDLLEQASDDILPITWGETMDAEEWASLLATEPA